MNTELNQKISQFLDDELHHTEMEGLLNKIKKHPELQNKMHRYQSVSHVLRMDEPVITSECLLERINKALENEPHHFLPKQAVKNHNQSTWQKTTMALAASVAIVAVIVTQQVTEQATETRQMLVAQTTDVTKTPVIAQAAVIENQSQHVAVTEKVKKASQHERFKAYLQAHSDDLYTHGALNVHPMARVAGYGQE